MKSAVKLIGIGLVLAVAAACAGGDGADPDAGDVVSAADAASADASVADAEIPDAEIPDAEIPDADSPDAEIPDADSPDATVDAAIVFVDAFVEPDAQPILCDPVAQTGCAATVEKCTQIIDAEGPPQILHTGCTPNGDIGPGLACTTPSVGADDCVAGYYCVGGFCEQICSLSPNSCPVTQTCQNYASVMDDRTNVGLCAPSCDPVLQDCADTSKACYLQAVSGATSCAAVPALSVGLVQDDACYGPAAGGCYLNGCDKGHGANLPSSPSAGDQVCAFFCNPIDNWLGNVQGVAGDSAGVTCGATFAGARPDGPGGSYECRFIQSFYSNTEAVAATTGMCLLPATWDGSCATFDWPQLQLDMADGTSDAPNYCDDYPERCMVECISLATFEAGSSQKAGGARYRDFVSAAARPYYVALD